MIFAWNDEDPVTGNADWKYHNENKRTVAGILIDYKDQSLIQQQTLPDDHKTVDLTMPNVYN